MFKKLLKNILLFSSIFWVFPLIEADDYSKWGFVWDDNNFVVRWSIGPANFMGKLLIDSPNFFLGYDGGSSPDHVCFYFATPDIFNFWNINGQGDYSMSFGNGIVTTFVVDADGIVDTRIEYVNKAKFCIEKYQQPVNPNSIFEFVELQEANREFQIKCPSCPGFVFKGALEEGHRMFYTSTSTSFCVTSPPNNFLSVSSYTNSSNSRCNPLDDYFEPWGGQYNVTTYGDRVDTYSQDISYDGMSFCLTYLGEHPKGQSNQCKKYLCKPGRHSSPLIMMI